MKKTTLVIGASGLVGTELVKQLLADAAIEKVKIFVRKIIPGFADPKLEQVVVDFENLKKHNEQITGDVMFCAMGTTIKTAGSQAAFAKVDYTYVLSFAELAKQNGVPRFLVVSSLGVKKSGGNFYLTVKRDVEDGLGRLKFNSLIIVRPSLLLGKRSEFRRGERFAQDVMRVIGFLLVRKLKKYKGIQAAMVATAMIRLSKTDLEGVSVFESDRLQTLGE